MINEQRQQQIQLFIRSLSNDELTWVYHQTGDKLRFIQRANELCALQDFQMLDRVFFHHNYEHIEGVVVRVNQRTLSVVTDQGRRWTVAPQYLKKVASDSSVPKDGVQISTVSIAGSTNLNRSSNRHKKSKNKHKKRK